MKSNSSSNSVLICICADLVSGQNRIKEFIYGLNQSCRIDKISNVYKRQKSPQRNDFNSELWLAIKAETALSASELKKVLDRLSDPQNSKSVCRGHLLTYNDFVWLQPELTLPNPALIEEKVILKCATEVWGTFEHPVLGETLNEITRHQPTTEGLEFFAQGRGLL